MSLEITTTEEIFEHEVINVWRLNIDDGTIIINISKLFDNTVTECNWIGNDKQFIEVIYTDWDSSEYFSIMNIRGDILKKGLQSIENYIEAEQLFIIIISGIGLEMQSEYYGLGASDWKMAVINRWGEFIIPPSFEAIKFDKEKQQFVGDNNRTVKDYFTLYGKYINN